MATGLQRALSERSWDVEVDSGPSAADAVDHVERFEPDCVLLDIYLGPSLGSAVDLIPPIRSTGSRVVVLTDEYRRLVLAACVEAGAEGWISARATLDELDRALEDVIAGRPLLGRTRRAALLDELEAERAAFARARAIFACLTPRERVVLGELIRGRSAEEIAEAHFVALTTVRSQIRCVLQKLGVRSQLAAVAVAAAHREAFAAESGQQRTVGGDREANDAPQTWNRMTPNVPAMSGGPNEYRTSS